MLKMKKYLLILFILIFTYSFSQKKINHLDAIVANKTTDFEITGAGTSSNWKLANWVNIEQRAHLNVVMETKVKVLYSETGIYFLFYNKDPKLDATIEENGMHLWTEDVVEVFLWPDTSKEVYFEYELSPLNYDLPLMVMNFDGKPHRWQAWYYEDEREIQHKTGVQGGIKESGASIESWTAEFFIPYSLLSPIGKPPVAGAEWKVNFNRMDYLDQKEIYWSWQDLPGSFHEIDRFGKMVFK
jgi:hypothetical protein